ncbi:thiol reductant ABC exporter subunit CydD [Paenibacillus ihbetae]|uniref:Thiol reductant ABC exporter subunit CydD n=1 Tax=Paenibacillus ihbetae TaxID=1870820 RepID=A0A1B2E1X7_9BACL|nr:ABC transporter ATP-binding protein/permease [Paenibacillus ihbetae]ANY73931.1 thiol reductant ABC exporter subunit CydD [Paenibacillus ihbetae]
MGKDLLGYRGAKTTFLLVAGCTLAQSMAILLQAKWLAETVSALFAGASLQEQGGTIALFLLAFLLRHGVGAVQQGLAQRFAEQTGASLRKELLGVLFQKGSALVRAEGTGNVVTLVLEGIGKFRKYAELTIPRLMGAGITPALVWLYVFMTDRISGIILLVTMPILIAFLILVGLAARKQTERQLDSYRLLSNHFVDSLRGLMTLKFLGQSRRHSASIQQVSEDYRKATMRTLRVAFLSSFALDFFTMLSVASVAVNLGLRLINGSIELLPALLVLILAPEYFLPVRMVGADFHATLDGKQAGEAMQSIIRASRAEGKWKPSVSEAAPNGGADGACEAAVADSGVGAGGAGCIRTADAADDAEAAVSMTTDTAIAATTDAAVAATTDAAIAATTDAAIAATTNTTMAMTADALHAARTDTARKVGAAFPAPILQIKDNSINRGSSPAVFRWDDHSMLELRGVGLRHESQGPASLEDVSFRIPGKGRIGIVGESGAGKSTLIDLLGGFAAPTAGEIRLNGVKLEEGNRETWRSGVTYMPQHPYLFSSTLQDNVRFYAPDASDADVLAAVEAAGLIDLVRTLPKGLHEMIGAGGRALSGGQAQRVALARALLGGRQVLLLDEPTAHLDIETEYELKETMLSLFRDRWVFLATHRLHWMRDMDFMIVLHRGRVAETGTHEELIQLKGVYYGLITSQMEGIG